MQLKPQTIIDTFIDLKPQERWSFRDVGRSETNSFSHGYHRYPAKFIPHIVKKLITSYTIPGERVCDPFGGCGTTLVESKLLGRPSVAFDINPVAKLITQVKITPIKPISLINYREKFINYYENIDQQDIEHSERLNYWFEEEILVELNRIYSAIKKIKNYNVRRFFLCAFSHNLKNCSRWLMKSIKPTLDKNKIVTEPIESFLRHLTMMINKNEKFYYELEYLGHSNVEAKMYRRDSTKKLPINNNEIDLIVTSPPYVTSYEYADLHQLTLLWLADDNKNFVKWSRFHDEYHELRKSFVGTTIIKQKRGEISSDIGDRIIEQLFTINTSLAKSVFNYYIDMKRAFYEMSRILKTGSKACIIIGNTNIKGVDILNAQVAAEQMANLGFKKVDFIKREVPNKMITPWRDTKNGKFTSTSNPNKKRAYEYEYIVIMEKN